MVKRRPRRSPPGRLNENYAEVHGLVTQYLKEHPESNPAEAARELGLDVRVYYSAVRRLRKIKAEKRLARISQPPVPAPGHSVMPSPRVKGRRTNGHAIIRTPDNIPDAPPAVSPDALFEFLLSSMQAEAKLHLALSIIRGER